MFSFKTGFGKIPTKALWSTKPGEFKIGDVVECCELNPMVPCQIVIVKIPPAYLYGYVTIQNYNAYVLGLLGATNQIVVLWLHREYIDARGKLVGNVDETKV